MTMHTVPTHLHILAPIFRPGSTGATLPDLILLDLGLLRPEQQ